MPINITAAQWSKYLAAGGAIVLIILGTLVMLGWYWHSVLLMQIAAQFPEMAFKTAICFSLSGCALLALLPGYRAVSICCSILVLGIIMNCIIESQFGLNLGINKLFPYRYYPDQTPVNIAPNIGVCFVLSVLALLSITLSRLRKSQVIFSITLSFIVMSFAIFFLAGYLVHWPTFYTWYGGNPIALHAVIGFIIFSSAIILATYSLSIEQAIKITSVIPLLIGCGVSVGVLLLWEELREQAALLSAVQLQTAGSMLPAITLFGGLLVVLLLILTIYLALYVRQRAKALELSQEQLHQAQKMEIIGQMTGGLAHDFNNLLMVIKGNLEMLCDRFPESSKESERLQAALGAAERGEALTRRLLLFARRQQLSPTIIDLALIIPGIINLLTPLLDRDIKINVNMAEELWRVFVDVGQLENALLNLALNARDALPKKDGKLTFDLRNIRLLETIHLSTGNIPPADYVKISVTDNGCGMLPEVLQRAHEPFFTTKETGKGSGLGLSMVYSFITQSQGYMTISSQPQQGTAVSLYLPRNDEVSSKPVEPLLQTARILLVEEDSEVRQATVDYLRGVNCQVTAAANCKEVLSILENDPAYDLLIINMYLSGNYSGFVLWQTAQKIQPQLRVLFTSGASRQTLFDSNMQNITENVISKPYKMLDLLVKIRKILM